MNKRIRVRLLIIVVVLAVCVEFIAGFPPRISQMKDRINLGLDLKGGIQLVLQVVTDDAIRATTDQTIATVNTQLQKANVPVRQIVRTEPGAFRIIGLEAAQQSQFRSAVLHELDDWDMEQQDAATYTFSLKRDVASSIREQTRDQVMRTIQSRIDQIGVTEPVIQKYGPSNSYQILVQLPGAVDTDRIKELIQATALLELKLVEAGPFATEDAARNNYGGSVPSNLELLAMAPRAATPAAYYVTERIARITGRDLKTAHAARDRNGHPAVEFAVTSAGAGRFAELTSQNIGKYLAIVLDGKIQSAAVISTRISDTGIIEGGPAGFPLKEAQDLAVVLRSGALPASIHYGGEELIGPTLGAESVRKGLMASSIALAAVAGFMAVYYRMAGINAIVAMILNILILLGAIAYFGITLTLPGIAAVTLTIGVGIDSNVLIFERIRDELRAGKTAASALTIGFSRVFITLVDTHIAALISAAFLFLFGTGPIKGFAVALVIGLVSNMFTSVFVSRTLFEWSLARQGSAAKIRI